MTDPYPPNHPHHYPEIKQSGHCTIHALLLQWMESRLLQNFNQFCVIIQVDPPTSNVFWSIGIFLYLQSPWADTYTCSAAVQWKAPSPLHSLHSGTLCGLVTGDSTRTYLQQIPNYACDKVLNKAAIQSHQLQMASGQGSHSKPPAPDGKWTRKPLAYRESSNV